MRITTSYTFLLSCIVLLLLDKSFAAECKLKCRGQSGSLLKLEEGVTYNYQLEGNTETLLPKSKGPFGESVKLNFKAKVEVSSLPECKTVIQLRQVQVTGPDGKVHQSLPKLEGHPLVVSLHGGKLDPEVCAVHEDDFSSLNIKRAVASLLQVSTGENGGHGTETDIFGVCPTHFKVSKDGEATVVAKYRDLEKCQYRENLRQSFFAVSHVHSSDMQSAPLLDSSYEGEQRIQNGILESATVKEEYLFRPFANKDNGARTKVHTKLVLESKTPYAPAEVANNEAKQIFFENAHETEPCSHQTLLAALHKIADSQEGGVSNEAAKDFADLVKLVRGASKEDLLSVYGDSKAGAGFQNRQLAKKVFTDALFAAGSASSVAAAVELLKSNEITGRASKYWYLSFAFVRHTSASALASATTLLDNPKLPAEAYLGIGALAGHYCREHNCEGVPEFDQLLAKLTEALGGKGSREKENNAIAALKGLKNVKHLNEETANRVTQLMKDGHASARVRVAAFETAQSDACRGKIPKGAADVFYNREEDSEFRIKAYLVMVECPTAKLANKLSEFLETEPVNQVGAFVTSHLRNLRSSSSPDKERAREVLYNVKPRRKFPFDVRKFSRNHEFSYTLDALSSSAAVESNVIFSQKSYLPRSVNLNLTVELFGHAFNLFEVNGRAENLERVYEKYFGPKGYFRNHNHVEIIKDTRKFYKDLGNRIEDKYKNLISRSRRSVSRDETNAFASKVKLFNSKMDENIDVDLSMRLLGNELSWTNIEDVETPLTPTSVVDRLAQFAETTFGRAKDYKKNYQNHFHFLDTQLNYPTSVGFPLRLNAVGSGVVYLKVGTECDLAAFIKDHKSGRAKFELVPSASIEVTGEFSVDGHVVEAGVKLAGNLHSSTGSEITLQMLDGHGFDVNIGLPVKKTDVVSFETEVFSFVREQGQVSTDHLLEFNVPRKDYQGCFDQLQPLLGLTFCGDFGFPTDQHSIVSSVANYPLNGHSKVSLRLEKEDETLTSYHMRYFIDVKNPKEKRIEFKVDTPGTKVPRELSFLAALKKEPEKSIDLQFISPIHRLIARGALVNNDAEYTISGSARIDDAQEYKAKIGFLKNGQSYRPILEYTPVGSVPTDIKVDGELVVEKQPGSRQKKFTFKALRIIHPKRTYSIDGTVDADLHSCKGDLHVNYETYNGRVKFNYENHGNNHLKLGGEVFSSKYPNYNFGMDYEYKRGDHMVDNTFSFAHGQDLDSPLNKFTFSQQLLYKCESFKKFDVAIKNKFSYPLHELQGRVDVAATRNSFNYEVDVKCGKHDVRSKLDAKTGVKAVGDYDVDFVVVAFDKELSLTAKREIVDAFKSRFTQKLDVKPGKSYDLAAEVTHHFGGSEMKLSIIATSNNFPNYVLDAGFLSTLALYNGHCKVNDGTKDVVDAYYKHSKKAPISANFKLFVENLVDSHAECKVDDKVSGSALANFVQLNKVVKGSFDLSRADRKYAGMMEVSIEKDGQPKWNLHVETDTEVKHLSINSRNHVKAYGKTVELNFHGTCRGKAKDASFTGGFDMTLPSGRFYMGNANTAHQIVHRNLNGELFLEFGYGPQKGGPMTKYVLDTYAKNFEIKRYSVDSKFEFGRDSPKGNFKFSSVFRSMPHNDEYIVDGETTLTGSYVKAPFESKGHGVFSRAEANFDVSSSLGTYHFKSRGKVLTGVEDRIRHLECQVEIDTPREGARRILLDNLVHYSPGDETKPYKFMLKQESTLNDKMFKLTGDADMNRNHGGIRGSLMFPGDPRPASFDLKYNREVVSDLSKAEISFTGNCGKETHGTLNGVFEYKRENYFVKGHITGQSTLKHFQSVDLQFSHKKLSSTARNTDFTLLLNGEKTEGSSKIDLGFKQSLIDVTVTGTGGKSRLYYKLNKKAEHQSSCEGQVAWAARGGGQIDFSSNVDIESYESFHVVLKVNSEKLELNKFKFEVGNRATKSGAAKRVNFVAQTADKKGFSGSATYAVKDTPHGFTVEGKGHIEFQSDKYPLTYKAEYKTLAKPADGESGKVFTLNVDFENGNFAVEQKFSDKNLFYLSKFCRDSHCAHSEIKYNFHVSAYAEYGYEALAFYKNNFPGRDYDFKIFAKTHRKLFTVDHESGVTMKDRSYTMKYYVHDGEGGVIFGMPHREVAAIASYDLPLDLTTGKQKSDIRKIQVRFDGSLYLDRRNKPNEKANLFMSGDLHSTVKSISSKGEIRVSHPALTKDLVLRGKAAAAMEQRLVDLALEVDIFNKKNQRMAATLTVDHVMADGGHNLTTQVEFISKGLNVDVGTSSHLFASEHGFSTGSLVYYNDGKTARKEAGAQFQCGRKRLYAMVRIPNRELFKIDSVIQGEPNNRVAEMEINFAELRHYTAKVETTGFHSMKATVFNKANPDRRLDVTASVNPKLFELRLENCEGPAKENLLLFLLTAKSNQEAQPNFEINSAKIKQLLAECKVKVKQLGEDLKSLTVDLSKQSAEEFKTVAKGVKKAQTDFKPLLQYYQNEFEALRNEFKKDPTVESVSSICRSLFGGLAEILEGYIKAIVQAYEKASDEFADLQNKLLETYKEVMVRLAHYCEKLMQPFTEVMDRVGQCFFKLADSLLDCLKANEGDIKKILVGISGCVQEFFQFWATSLDEWRVEMGKFCRGVIDKLKTLPLYTNFEEKYKELTNVELPQTLKNFYSEITFAAEDMMKTPELKNLAENFMGYLIKFPVPSFLVRLPKFGAVKEFTFIRYFEYLSELPSLSEFYYTYRPYFRFSDNIPPFSASAIILSSHHIFTFDQKHYALKGTCSYVLAQDFLDGNFSLMANFESGKIKSITLNDETDTVEVFNDNTVSVNGQHGDYPVSHNNFGGWMRYGTFNLKHKSGVHLTKYLAQDMFIFRLSGFYFGRTRGLLGTISNEQYDDYLLPNGNIAKDAAEFADAYKVNEACPAAPVIEPHQGHVPECTKFFSSESTLRTGFNLVNHEIYREACDLHAGSAAGDKLKPACDVAAAYALALKQGYMSTASVPDECVQCVINGQPASSGQDVTFQSPQGKADVVIVFEQSAFNSLVFKELITPLIPALTNDLKEKGLGDVEFALIGYGGPEHKWPAHFANNGKVTYEGNADKIKFKTAEDPKPDYSKWEDRFNAMVKFFKVELGKDQIVMAMDEANTYPFRQGAAKIILLVTSQSCPLSPLFPFSLQMPRILAIRRFYKESGLQFHFISPMSKTMSLSNQPETELKNVVGFDAQRIYTFADAKKSDLEGDATNRPHLVYEQDLCAAFSQYNGGAAFNSNVFAHAKPEQQKKFVNIVSRRVAKGAAENRFTENCYCKLYHGIFYYPKCKVTETV